MTAKLAAILLAAYAIYALTGCRRDSDPRTSTTSDAAETPSLPPNKRPSPQGCIHWLYQNSVNIPLEAGLPAWEFKPEEVSNLEVVSSQEVPNSNLLSADVAFQVKTGGKAYQVRGTIRYRLSEAYKPLLIYEEYKNTSVERL
jgi:hypothetical protein